MFDDEVYDSVEDVFVDVDKIVGWDWMCEICESYNDVMFFDVFFFEEFVCVNYYFVYEYFQLFWQFCVFLLEYWDVKKKFLFQFINFGKLIIVVYDGNFDNCGEFFLGYQYNGVIFDMKQVKGVLECVYYFWGWLVNLMIIMKEFDEYEVEVVW